MTKLISGKEISEKINEQIKKEVKNLKSNGINPCLAVILVGEDPASQVYVRNKKRTCENLEIKSIGHNLPASTNQKQLEILFNDLKSPG